MRRMNVAKTLSAYVRSPKKAEANRGEAWWYSVGKGIELHLRDGDAHYLVKLSPSALREFVKHRNGKYGKPGHVKPGYVAKVMRAL